MWRMMWWRTLHSSYDKGSEVVTVPTSIETDWFESTNIAKYSSMSIDVDQYVYDGDQYRSLSDESTRSISIDIGDSFTAIVLP